MRFITTSIIALCVFTFCSCSKPKEPDTNIITTKPVVKKQDKPQTTGDYKQTQDVVWMGGNYTVTMMRTADKNLPLVDDGNGVKYYDNKITITITRSDGSVFFEHTFTKNDFCQQVVSSYLNANALLGIVFNKEENNNLYFAGSVGSPDALSDEYIPLEISISSTGSMSIKQVEILDD